MRLTTTVLFILSFALNVNSQLKYSIPFELIDYRIYLKGTINEVECSFLYDTGDFGVALDKLFIEKNGIEIPKYAKKNVFLIRFNNFEKQLSSVTSQDINIIGGNSDEGVIGIDFFKDFIVEIDYEQQVLKLFDINTKIDNSYSEVETNQFKGLILYGRFTTKLEIVFNENSCLNGDFLFDTGSGRNITIFSQLDSNLDSENPIRKGMNSSYHGNNISEFIKTKEVFFNNGSFLNLIVDRSFDTNKEVANRIDGVIGGQFLQNFNIILNYTKHAVYLKQNNNDNFTKEMLTDGIIYRDRRKDLGGLLVSAKIEHELLNDKFKLGDLILEINGNKVVELDYFYMRNLQLVEGNKIHYKVLRKRKKIDIVTEVLKVM